MDLGEPWKNSIKINPEKATNDLSILIESFESH